MPEPHGSPAPEPTGAFDREISVRALVLFFAGLALITLVSFWLMYLFYHALLDRAIASDPALSPLHDKYEAREPPQPRLQTDPESELIALRAAEAERLSTYGWVDRERGIAHMPVERAMELLAAGAGPAGGGPAGAGPAGADPETAGARGETP